MKKIALLLLIGVVITNLSGCKKHEITSQQRQTAIKIDGDDSDWKGVPLMISDKINSAIGVINDDENLYVLLRLNDYRTVRKIQMRGLALWIDSHGKKKKEYGLRYIGSQALIDSLNALRNTDKENRNSSRMTRMHELLKDYLPQPGMLAVIQRGRTRFQPEYNPWGPSAASVEKNGFYCFEFRIPLNMQSSVVTEQDDQADQLPEKIKLCLELGGLSEEMRSEMKSSMQKDGSMMGGKGGMRGGGMGGSGMGGGGMGGGRGGKMGGGRMSGGQQLENEEMWLDVILAK